MSRLPLLALLLALTPLAGAAAQRRPAAPPPTPGTVTGRVLLPGGKPAAGARVWLTWGTARGEEGLVPGRTDASGAYRLVLKPRTLSFLALGAHADGGAPTWRAIVPRLLGPRPLTVNVPLATPVTLVGRLVRPDGSPAAGVRVGVRAVRPAPPAEPDQAFWLNVDRYVDPAVLRLYVAHSGPDGAFELPGLPPGTDVALAFPEDLLLPTGLPEHLRLSGPGRQPIGHLAVTRPAALSVQALTPEGQPAPGAAVHYRRVLPEPAEPFARALTLPWRAAAGEPRHLEIEADGTGRAERLMPGRYEVAIQGAVTTVDLSEGGAPPPLKLVQRSGLVGRVVDAGGSPVNAARVTVEVGAPRGDWPPGPAAPSASDAQGQFRCEDFPWGAPVVVVRASLGNAEAEWRGEGAAAPRLLVLRLQPGVLLSAKGRLVGPDGKPLAGAPVALFTREDGQPRGLVIGRSDNEARFNLPGLRRGLRFAVGTVADDQPLESTPFDSAAEGEAQDLGDVRVSLSAPPGGLIGPRLAEVFTPAPILPPAEAEAAVEAAWRALNALRGGDLKALADLTTLPGPGGAGGVAGLLAGRPLLVPTDTARLARADLGAMRVFPRLLPDAFFGPLESERAYSDLLAALSHPEWALVGYRSPRGVLPLALVRREGAVWRVVGGLLADPQPLTTAAGDATLWGVPAGVAPEAARAAAQAYLRAWAAGDDDARRALTHPRAVEHDATREGFARKWAARPPVPPPAPDVALTPEATLSRWDLASLFVYPATLAAMRALRPSPPWSLTRFPYPDVHSGRAAVMRYRVGNLTRLLLLAREGETWLVVEPALPEGAATAEP